MDVNKTPYSGVEYRLSNEINPAWSDYDKVVADTHLSNVGYIIIDNVYFHPIDNEADLDEIYKQLKANEKLNV